MAKRGSDADRRLRQCERLGRTIRLLGLIQSPGGSWTPLTLARELGCSERTVYRDLQTLELTGVPFFWDDESGSYRVRPGYKAPQISARPGKNPTPEALIDFSLQAAARMMAEAGRVVDALERHKEVLHATDHTGRK